MEGAAVTVSHLGLVCFDVAPNPKGGARGTEASLEYPCVIPAGRPVHVPRRQG